MHLQTRLLRPRLAFTFGVSLATLLTGCGAGASVQSDDGLPVTRVVLYRNGVGYFERSGEFEGSELQFGVRRSDVGDFLTTLTAFERTEGGVRSVSFEVPEDPPPPPPPVPAEGEPALPTAPAAPSNPRSNVRLFLGDDGTHDVTVAYVVAAPIWRPSYRVVVDEGGRVLLQAWAVVQNTSGEDWRDVQLSVTTGSPIAFQSDLGTPVTPPRPMIRDTGEVVGAVPQSETVYATAQPTLESLAEGDGASMMDEEVAMAMPMAQAPGAPASAGMGAGPREARRQNAPARTRGGFSAEELARSVRSMAQVASLGASVTRYDLNETVTIPDGGSTMVTILSRKVPGEEAQLFAPDPGVPLSATHPFRVVRLTNHTGALLERGPIAVLARATFLGQGVLDPLPRDATAFVPFAVDRTVAVESSTEQTETDGRLVRISRGQLTIERFSQRITKYRARNGGEARVKLYIRHARLHGAEIQTPTELVDTSELSTLVPVEIPARDDAEVRVVERTPVERTVQFLSDLGADAVALYLRGPAVDAAQGAALRRALELRTQLLAAQQRVTTATSRRAELMRTTEEVRANLMAVENLTSAADLRQRLVRRLTDLDAQIADQTRIVVEGQTSASELRVRLAEALEDVTLDGGAAAARPAAP